MFWCVRKVLCILSFRYFTKAALKELFILDDTSKSTTQVQLQELHNFENDLDPTLNDHVEYMKNLSKSIDFLLNFKSIFNCAIHV